MATVQVRSTRLTQPQGLVSVDWSNPIARGLLIAAPGATSGEMRNAVDGRAFTRAYAPTTTIASTPVGLGFLNDTFSYDELSVGQDLSELTALVVTLKPATGGQAFSGPFSIGNESNNTQAITVEDGLYFSCWSSTGARSNALASGVTLSPIGAVQTLALSLATSTTTMRGYVNGSRAATGSAPSTLRSTLSSSFRVGANHAGGHGAIHPAAFLWSRQLTDEEIASVSANPWQLFSPVQRRVYFDMGASGGATTSVSTDLAAEYKIRSTVHADGAGAYAVRSVVAADTSTEYSIRGAISSDVSASYIVRALAQADIHSAYLVRVAVQADAASTFTVRGDAASDATAAYLLRGSASSELSASYDIQTASGVGASLDASYNVRAAVQSDASAAYDLRTSVGATSEHAFMVRGLVSSDLDASFTVDASLVPVYADMQAAYLVDGGAVFIPSQFVASVPSGVFSARAPAGEYSATVPAGIFKASI